MGVAPSSVDPEVVELVERAQDGRRAGVAVDPFRVTVAPLADYTPGTPLEGLKVELRGLTVASNVAAAPAPLASAPEPAPAPEPEPEPALPRTGGGAATALLGTLALGGAFALRRHS